MHRRKSQNQNAKKKSPILLPLWKFLFCLINIFLFPRFRLIFQLLVFGCKDKKDGGFLAPFSQADLALWRYSACLQTLARSHNRPKPLAIPLPSIVFFFIIILFKHTANNMFYGHHNLIWKENTPWFFIWQQSSSTDIQLRHSAHTSAIVHGVYSSLAVHGYIWPCGVYH